MGGRTYGPTLQGIESCVRDLKRQLVQSGKGGERNSQTHTQELKSFKKSTRIFPNLVINYIHDMTGSLR